MLAKSAKNINDELACPGCPIVIFHIVLPFGIEIRSKVC